MKIPSVAPKSKKQNNLVLLKVPILCKAEHSKLPKDPMQFRRVLPAVIVEVKTESQRVFVAGFTTPFLMLFEDCRMPGGFVGALGNLYWRQPIGASCALWYFEAGQPHPVFDEPGRHILQACYDGHWETIGSIQSADDMECAVLTVDAGFPFALSGHTKARIYDQHPNASEPLAYLSPEDWAEKRAVEECASPADNKS